MRPAWRYRRGDGQEETAERAPRGLPTSGRVSGWRNVGDVNGNGRRGGMAMVLRCEDFMPKCPDAVHGATEEDVLACGATYAP